MTALKKVFCEVYPWNETGRCVLVISDEGRPMNGVWIRPDVNSESGLWMAKYDLTAKAPSGGQVVGWNKDKGLVAGAVVENGQESLPVEMVVQGLKSEFFVTPDLYFNPRLGQWEEFSDQSEAE